MKTNLSLIGLALLAMPTFAAPPQPSMVFTSAAVADHSGSGQHEIYQYRAGGKLIVVVLDPIVCGQTAVHPRVSVEKDHLILQYDLTEAPTGARQSCTEDSVFQVGDLPGGMLRIGFAGGAEPYQFAAIKQ